MTSAIKLRTTAHWKAWAGPVDGLVLELPMDRLPQTNIVYVRLPVTPQRCDVDYAPPPPPYAAYILGEPSRDKARWLPTHSDPAPPIRPVHS